MRTLRHYLFAAWMAASAAGCGAALVNHTATTETIGTHPSFVDGDATTFGATEFSGPSGIGDHSQAVVELAQPRVLSKMIVDSPDLLSFEVFTRDVDSGEWTSRAYHQSYRPATTGRTEVRLKGRPRSDAILLRVLRTEGDTKNRTNALTGMNRAYEAATMRNAGPYGLELGRQAVDSALARSISRGDLQSVATIHEIELFGPAAIPE